MTIKVKAQLKPAPRLIVLLKNLISEDIRRSPESIDLLKKTTSIVGTEHKITIDRPNCKMVVDYNLKHELNDRGPDIYRVTFAKISVFGNNEVDSYTFAPNSSSEGSAEQKIAKMFLHDFNIMIYELNTLKQNILQERADQKLQSFVDLASNTFDEYIMVDTNELPQRKGSDE